MSDALTYAARGWRVFPCHVAIEGRCSCGKADCEHPGKHPRTRRGVHDATADVDRIRAWWTRWPDANVAIACGAPGPLVLDVDDLVAGRAVLDQLAALDLDPPTVATARGRHFYFAGDDRGTVQLPFGELRGRRSYVVAPPSVHPSGKHYTWLVSPTRAALPALPAFLAKQTKRDGPAPPIEDVIPEGARDATLTSLAGTMRDRGMGATEITAALIETNRTRCTPALTEREVVKIVHSVLRYEPRRAPATGRRPRHPAATPTNELLAVKASTVKPANVRWAWQGWVPLGMLSILLGLPGRGKTTVAELLAADVTCGRLVGDLAGRPAAVLVVSYEDAIPETLVPRLAAAEADLDHVHFLVCRDAGRVLDLTRHLGDVERMAREFGARMLIIDPLVAGMPAGDVNSHRDQDVRSVLAPLAALAAQLDLAVLATMHFSKAATSALLGAGGSIGFVGAARSILVFGVDPTDERGDAGPARVLAHAKCNVGRLQRSRRVQVLPHVLDPFGAPIETSVAVLGETCDVSADGLVRVGKTTPRMNARRFLQELLADGPHRASEIYELAEDAGIAERTLKRAKGDLGVVSEKQGDGWWWRRPAEGDREGSDDDASDEGELS